MDPFLGQLMLVGFNYAPNGWALCQGQLLSIAQNSALFSLLGTQYGGDGVTTFGLPDLRGRVPLGFGQGPGLQAYTQGELGGTESVTLVAGQMPAHNHTVSCVDGDPNDASPANSLPAHVAAGGYSLGTANATMSPAMIVAAGGSQPHENRQPFMVLNWIIASEGVFPPRQ